MNFVSWGTTSRKQSTTSQCLLATVGVCKKGLFLVSTLNCLSVCLCVCCRDSQHIATLGTRTQREFRVIVNRPLGPYDTDRCLFCAESLKDETTRRCKYSYRVGRENILPLRWQSNPGREPLYVDFFFYFYFYFYVCSFA